MLKLTAITQVLAERKRWHQSRADDYFISKKTTRCLCDERYTTTCHHDSSWQGRHRLRSNGLHGHGNARARPNADQSRLDAALCNY